MLPEWTRYISEKAFDRFGRNRYSECRMPSRRLWFSRIRKAGRLDIRRHL